MKFGYFNLYNEFSWKLFSADAVFFQVVQERSILKTLQRLENVPLQGWNWTSLKRGPEVCKQLFWIPYFDFTKQHYICFIWATPKIIKPCYVSLFKQQNAQEIYLLIEPYGFINAGHKWLTKNNLVCLIFEHFLKKLLQYFSIFA